MAGSSPKVAEQQGWNRKCNYDIISTSVKKSIDVEKSKETSESEENEKRKEKEN